jgi:hypothetical protein
MSGKQAAGGEAQQQGRVHPSSALYEKRSKPTFNLNFYFMLIADSRRKRFDRCITNTYKVFETL